MRLLRLSLLVLALGLMASHLTMAKNQNSDNRGKPVTSTTIEIYDDGANGTGGDCGAGTKPIGSWDASNKTCTLIRDVNAAIRIHDPNDTEVGVTLDGDEYAVNLPSDGSIRIEGSHHTLEDLAINGYPSAEPTSNGVYLSDAYFTTITNVQVSNTQLGVGLHASMHSIVSDNTFSGVRIGAYFSGTYNEYFCEDEEYLPYCGSSYNILENNTFSAHSVDHDDYGVMLYFAARDNTIRGNTITGFNYGVYIPDWYCSYIYTSYSSCQDGNTVYQNNFIDNFIDDYVTSVKTQIYADWGYTTTVFNLDAPDGGNYFNDFDELAEGCVDANGDGFCDICYYGKNTYDCLPWTTEQGWSTEDDDD
jgi:hypothetical protein